MKEKHGRSQKNPEIPGIWSQTKGREWSGTNGFKRVDGELKPHEEILVALASGWFDLENWHLAQVRTRTDGSVIDFGLVLENPSNPKCAESQMITKTLFHPEFYPIFERQQQFIKGMGYAFNLYQLRDEAQDSINAFPLEVQRIFVHAQRIYQGDVKNWHIEGRIAYVLFELIDLTKKQARIDKEIERLQQQSAELGSRVKESVTI